MGLLIAACGAVMGLRAAEREAVAEWEHDLRARAGDRRTALESWLEGRRATLRVASAYPTVVWLLSGRPAGSTPFPVETGPEAHVQRLFDTLCAESGFASAIVADREGRILATGGAPSDADRAPTLLAGLARRAEATLELHAEAGSCEARFVEPVRAPAGGDALGVLVMREDASRGLAPTLAWAGRSATSSESFLVERRDGTTCALAARALGRGFRPCGALDAGVGGVLERVFGDGTRPGTTGVDEEAPFIGAFAPVRGATFGFAATVSRADAVDGRQTAVVTRVAAVSFASIACLLGALTLRESKRARREAEDHARDARLVSAIEHTRDVALFLREDGTIVEALGATERIYGVAPGALVGRTFPALRAPSGPPPPSQEACVDPASDTLAEETHRRADGALVAVETSTSRVTGTDGDRWYLALVRDVSDRRRAEEATRTLVRAVEQSPVSIVVTDLVGNIAYVNPHFCRVTGYDAAEVRGANARILKSGETPPAVYADLWRTIREGRVWQGELVNRRKDGTRFTERAAIAPVADADGVVRNYVAVKEDLSVRLALEERARSAETRFLQAQKLEAVGRLAGGVAHDFNNLLCVILGYGQLVADALGATSPQAAHVAQIVRAGRAAEALTRQLLAFSHRQVLETRILDLNHVVQRVEKMLRRLIGDDIALATEYSSEPAVVRADAGQLEQILMNLAVNARDAMQNGGRLTIRTSLARGGERWETGGVEIPVGPWVVLSVSDTGVGMDAATKARVFEPFFTTKPPGAGTGLGLATVYGIVSQSGGHVAFATAPGAGTEFRIHLPHLALEAEEEDRAPEVSAAYEGDETVLVAEDQEPVRQIVRIWLERHGYRVLDAADGQAAIELAAAHDGRVDLLLADVMMPRADGRQLAAALRARDPGLPVVYVSGYAADVIESKGLLEPGVRLLGKPLSEPLVLRAVREALDARAREDGRRGSAST